MAEILFWLVPAVISMFLGMINICLSIQNKKQLNESETLNVTQSILTVALVSIIPACNVIVIIAMLIKLLGHFIDSTF